MSRKPVRLADLDPKHTAEEMVRAVQARARRDARWLGLSLKVDPLPAGMDQKAAGSAAFRLALARDGPLGARPRDLARATLAGIGGDRRELFIGGGYRRGSAGIGGDVERERAGGIAPCARRFPARS